ncbi:hypothetical protein K493DRAFT_322526 [Basidiobolus meristosporus CBS 931.73]|uniref:P-loop containing nucleoside triphosphate hydrolase protein n=1 Tax=Basidiobolus meristosporus CBS 931.73 TaxID=1314790 RepID=A0A1Y1Z9J5_9FUNG|nr:hypothetical protein K493DRAFT_322526 [Basidiobolus meristosporus CBS 931.73]|eukprot:ORY06455.1 hypothetical protein K493DRAFT_322526 [Basidiobolus meristosporus CBS 931.73]
MANSSRLEVIGAGFCRTGTLSTKTALDKLGYNTHHMVEVGKNPDVQGKPNWDKIFEDYTASVDCPSFWWYKDLMKKYPDAKVLLTVRDPEKWYKSCYDTVYKFSMMTKGLKLEGELEKMNDMIAAIDATVWGPTGCFQGRFEDKEWVIELFKSHIEEVKRVVPANKLLVFEVKEGWEPLCKFLGKPVPDEPFPHVNDTAEMQARMEKYKAMLPK